MADAKDEGMDNGEPMRAYFCMRFAELRKTLAAAATAKEANEFDAREDTIIVVRNLFSLLDLMLNFIIHARGGPPEDFKWPRTPAAAAAMINSMPQILRDDAATCMHTICGHECYELLVCVSTIAPYSSIFISLPPEVSDIAQAMLLEAEKIIPLIRTE